VAVTEHTVAAAHRICQGWRSEAEGLREPPGERRAARRGSGSERRRNHPSDDREIDQPLLARLHPGDERLELRALLRDARHQFRVRTDFRHLILLHSEF
jgi:hypothetical protein